jgi:large subunit ribosomal protein L18
MLLKVENRIRRSKRIQMTWTALRPRLCIFRSNANIYAQLIDDVTWTTLAAASDLKAKKKGTKSEMAKVVWAEIAAKAKAIKIEAVVFDRAGFAYHGRVKALAEWAREAGLKF